MEVEAVDEGVVEAILVPEGTEEVKVNTPIARLKGEGGAGASAAATRSAGSQRPAPPRGGAGDGRLRHRTVAGEGGAARRSPAHAAPTPSPCPAGGGAHESDRAGGERVFASPLARRLAEAGGRRPERRQGLRAARPDHQAGCGGAARARPAAASPRRAAGGQQPPPLRPPRRARCSRSSRWASRPAPTTWSRSTA